MKPNKASKPSLENRNLPLAESHSDVEITLIKTALGEIDPSSAEAVKFFNAGLPDGHKARVSRQTIWYWVNGEFRVQESRLRTWKAFSADDPRHQLATDIFALREREAAFDAHWIGNSGVKMTKRDAKKLLKTLNKPTAQEIEGA